MLSRRVLALSAIALLGALSTAVAPAAACDFTCVVTSTDPWCEECQFVPGSNADCEQVGACGCRDVQCFGELAEKAVTPLPSQDLAFARLGLAPSLLSASATTCVPRHAPMTPVAAASVRLAPASATAGKKPVPVLSDPWSRVGPAGE